MQTRCGRTPSIEFLSLAILGALLLLPWGARAQGAPTVSASAGITVPTGPFSDQVGETAGLAEQGWTVGVDLSVPIGGDAGLNWFSSLEAMSFGASDAFMSAFAGDGVELDMGSYFGSLLATGLRYDAEVNPFMVLHFGGQVGAGFFKAPDATVSGMGDTIELVSFYTPVHGFGGSLGATVNGRVRIDAKYFHLRNPEIEGELQSSGITEPLDGEQPMAWVRIGVAIKVR